MHQCKKRRCKMASMGWIAKQRKSGGSAESALGLRRESGGTEKKMSGSARLFRPGASPALALCHVVTCHVPERGSHPPPHRDEWATAIAAITQIDLPLCPTSMTSPLAASE